MEPTINQDVTATPEPSAPTNKKENSGLKIATIICAVLAVAGIGFGIYGFFFKKPTANEAISSLSQEDVAAIAVVSDAKELPITNNPENQEITITNPYLKKDLDHKIAILHDINTRSKEADSFIKQSPAYNTIDAVYDNSLTAIQKAIIVIKGALSPIDNYPYSVMEAIDDYIKTNYPDRYNDIRYRIGNIGFVSYDDLNDLMHDMFGYEEDVPKDALANSCTEQYLYVESVDGFIVGGFTTGGCGGAGFPVVIANKIAYTAKGDEAYVYIRGGTALLRNNGYALYGRHYSTFNTHTTKEEPAETDLLQDGLGDDDLANMDSSVSNNCQLYRFVFKKNKDGIYSFVRVEEA